MRVRQMKLKSWERERQEDSEQKKTIERHSKIENEMGRERRKKTHGGVRQKKREKETQR